MPDLDQEEEANRFAIELLLPTESFKKSFYEWFPGGSIDLIGSDSRVKEFADLWGVSEYLICFRIGKFSKY
jgi:Zn-dependent peptidase ImmA (M78 family)